MANFGLTFHSKH